MFVGFLSLQDDMLKAFETGLFLPDPDLSALSCHFQACLWVKNGRIPFSIPCDEVDATTLMGGNPQELRVPCSLGGFGEPGFCKDPRELAVRVVPGSLVGSSRV